MNELEKKYGIYNLTPVENYYGMYFKRDDLYKPFEDIPLSGGKVRQCLSLFIDKKDDIESKYSSTVVTGSSVTSPQGIIVSRVCKEFGYRSIVFVGNTNPDNLKKKTLMRNILNMGGEFNCESVLAYNSVIDSTIKRKIEEGLVCFNTGFGINVREGNRHSILDSVAFQVQNIPNNLDYLVVPCGSCIMYSGILLGVKKYHKNIKHVVGVQISGYDRHKDIDSMLNDSSIDYDFRISKDYPYHKEVLVSITKNFHLDRIYEAKTFKYLINHMRDEIRGKSVCLWVVGDSSAVRDNLYY